MSPTHPLVICVHSFPCYMSALIHFLCISTNSLVNYLHSFTYCYLSPLIHLLSITMHSFTCYLSPLISYLLSISTHSFTCSLSPLIHSLVICHHSFTHLLSISTHVIGTSHRFPLFHITHTEYVSFRTGDGVAKG